MEANLKEVGVEPNNKLGISKRFTVTFIIECDGFCSRTKVKKNTLTKEERNQYIISLYNKKKASGEFGKMQIYTDIHEDLAKLGIKLSERSIMFIINTPLKNL